jgi:hypothetical protein
MTNTETKACTVALWLVIVAVWIFFFIYAPAHHLYKYGGHNDVDPACYYTPFCGD